MTSHFPKGSHVTCDLLTPTLVRPHSSQTPVVDSTANRTCVAVYLLGCPLI